MKQRGAAATRASAGRRVSLARGHTRFCRGVWLASLALLTLTVYLMGRLFLPNNWVSGM